MDVPINYLQPPAVIVNQALTAIGVADQYLGDISDGTKIGEAARYTYGQTLRQLLRSSHWGFARKNAKLTLLGDATGNSPAPVISQVECPWQYAYAWPIDGVQGIWMPYNYPNGQPLDAQGIPLTTGVSAVWSYQQTPGRFLVSSSNLYPLETGYLTWDQLPDLQRTEGLGPINRKIILTNCCNAYFVYTRLVTVIEEWDDLFREAMVSLMALRLIPVAIVDPKERLTQRNAMIAIVKNAIADARVASGNEAGYPQSTDFEASWIRARTWGMWGAGFGDGIGGGLGQTFMNYETFSFGGGSVF